MEIECYVQAVCLSCGFSEFTMKLIPSQILVELTYNSRTQEAEIGQLPRDGGQPTK